MTTLVLAALLIAATILIHYEILRHTSLGANDLEVNPRVRLWMMLSAAILSHVLHVTLYAGGYLLLENVFAVGTIAGPDSGALNDAFYFSLTSYTTLGIGDIYPTGEIRLLSGLEALNGLVMVTWTASMTYLHMERFWTIHLTNDFDD
ncbi:two pore domain potassium channel family protein [Erythrobacter insulae]|uniref:Two pore domain potassium channel family protein n=1 Tax=Erythrobacter insulae TaxID=2584124 RepID=A0A547PBL4_9SPHN|nr:potassium channel family protein [Erythrobacter insulae]TRD11531.1 two pore domain potassium channel family protein [Erythrobacter insulae]